MTFATSSGMARSGYNGVYTSTPIQQPPLKQGSTDRFPFQAYSYLDSGTWKIKMRHGYLNDILPKFGGVTWVNVNTSSAASAISVTNTSNYLVVEFKYDIVTQETTLVDIKAVASVATETLSGDLFTCQIGICALTWTGTVLTSITQLRYGNLQAQIWGGNLSYWIA